MYFLFVPVGIIAIVFTLMWGDHAMADGASVSWYLDESVEIRRSPDAKVPPSGKLLVATAITILSRQDDWIEVVVKGWSQQDAERVIYAAPGMRVRRAVVTKSAAETLTFSEIYKDADTGLVWTRTTLRGWLNNPVLQADLDSIWRRAEPLFAKRCTACHQRRIPHHYTANQWTSHLKVMGPRTGLPREDQYLIRAYLQYHSKDAHRLGRYD